MADMNGKQADQVIFDEYGSIAHDAADLEKLLGGVGNRFSMDYVYTPRQYGKTNLFNTLYTDMVSSRIQPDLTKGKEHTTTQFKVGDKVHLNLDPDNYTGYGANDIDCFITEHRPDRISRPYTVYMNADGSGDYIGLFHGSELSLVTEPAKDIQQFKIGDIVETIERFECDVKVGSKLKITDILENDHVRYTQISNGGHQCSTHIRHLRLVESIKATDHIHQYQVGDLVKITAGISSDSKKFDGQTLPILKCKMSGDKPYYAVVENGGGLWPDELELVTPKKDVKEEQMEPIYNVGDWVEITGNGKDQDGDEEEGRGAGFIGKITDNHTYEVANGYWYGAGVLKPANEPIVYRPRREQLVCKPGDKVRCVDAQPLTDSSDRKNGGAGWELGKIYTVDGVDGDIMWPANGSGVYTEFLELVTEENNTLEGDNHMSSSTKYFKVTKETPELMEGAILKPYSGNDYVVISDLWNQDGVEEEVIVKNPETKKNNYERVFAAQEDGRTIYVDKATARQLLTNSVSAAAKKK